MGKETFIIYTSFYKPISILSDKQLGRLLRAIFKYNLGEAVDVEDDIRMAFEFFKNQFEIDERKYQNKVMRDIENGRKGGAARSKKKSEDAIQSESTPASKIQPPLTPANPRLGTLTINDNVYDNDNINVVDVDHAHARESLDAYQQRLSEDAMFWENAAMSRHVDIETLKAMLPRFVADSKARDKTDATYSDFKNHFLSWFNCQDKPQKHTRNDTNDRYSKRRGADSAARSPDDYTGAL